MNWRIWTIAVVLSAACGLAAIAFTLFDFPTLTAVQSYQVARWQRQPSRTPFTLTFKVDPSFLANQGSLGGSAREAAISAMNSWSSSTAGFFRFVEETRWNAAVPNANPLPPRWEGPSGAEWLANQAFFQSQGIVPGWGANVEIFSRPTGFTITSQSLVRTMSAGNAAFAVVNTTAGVTRIVSVDIYLNESLQWSTNGGPGFDVETVVLHELGHALGLDHPDEAAAEGSPNLNPYTFLPGRAPSTADVMFNAYTGVKRVLTEDEKGGMAFLYPSGVGDLNGDAQVTLVDIARAASFLEGADTPSAYELNQLDFLDNNQRFDPVELAYMLQWATGAQPYSPTGPTLRSKGFIAPATVTVHLESSRPDLGKGGPVTIAARIENPSTVPVVGWGARLLYDPSVLSNPRCVAADFPAGSLKIADLNNDGAIEISNVGAVPDTGASGTIFAIEFDVNLPAAVAVQELDFTLDQASIVVNINSNIRNFGEPGEEIELRFVTVSVSDLDASRDGVVDLLDLYAWHDSPIDVDRDSVINDADRRRLVECLRDGEPADLLPAVRLP